MTKKPFTASALRHSPTLDGPGQATAKKKYLKGSHVAKLKVAQQSSRAVGKSLANKYRGSSTTVVVVLDEVMGTTARRESSRPRDGRVAEMSLDLAGY